jgi:hypothetical protein
MFYLSIGIDIVQSENPFAIVRAPGLILFDVFLFLDDVVGTKDAQVVQAALRLQHMVEVPQADWAVVLVLVSAFTVFWQEVRKNDVVEWEFRLYHNV